MPSFFDGIFYLIFYVGFCIIGMEVIMEEVKYLLLAFGMSLPAVAAYFLGWKNAYKKGFTRGEIEGVHRGFRISEKAKKE